MKTALEVFSDNLDQLLAKQEKTQADLARYMKVSTATASDWCNAHKMPRVDKIKAIANWLHVSMGDLLEERHYMDDESAELANFLRENPDYKVLFSAVQNVRPEDISFVKEMIERMTPHE